MHCWSQGVRLGGGLITGCPQTLVQWNPDMQIESKYLSKSGSRLPVSVVVCAAILVLKPPTKVPEEELNLRQTNTLQISVPKPTETGSIQRSPSPVSTLARVFLKRAVLCPHLDSIRPNDVFHT